MQNKLPAKNTVADAFSNVAKHEQTVRRIRRKEQKNTDAARKRERAATARTEKQGAARRETYQKGVTQKLFPGIVSSVEKVFGKNGRVKAQVTSDAHETQLELTLQAPSGSYVGAPMYKDQAYALTGFMRDGTLSFMTTGYAVDPQYRGYRREVTPEHFITLAAEMAGLYASDAELRKLRKLDAAPRKKPAP